VIELRVHLERVQERNLKLGQAQLNTIAQAWLRHGNPERPFAVNRSWRLKGSGRQRHAEPGGEALSDDRDRNRLAASMWGFISRRQRSHQMPTDLGMGKWFVSRSTQTNTPSVPILDIDLTID